MTHEGAKFKVGGALVGGERNDQTCILRGSSERSRMYRLGEYPVKVERVGSFYTKSGKEIESCNGS